MKILRLRIYIDKFRPVKRVLNIKFLGITSDCRLKEDIHIKQVIKKGRSLINIIACCCLIGLTSLVTTYNIQSCLQRGY